MNLSRLVLHTIQQGWSASSKLVGKGYCEMRNSTTCTQEIKHTVIKSSLELTHKFTWCRLLGYGLENSKLKRWP